MCIRAIISGKVQGVFFRNTTRQKASKLGLTGWIKNLSNGEVELVACGERNSIMIFTKWLWIGPPFASVSNVHCEEIPWENHIDFNIR